MAKTVIAAFDEFMDTEVNLSPSATAGARASRDWLWGQIASLPTVRADFPRLYPDVDIHYGSFARRTKIRELDDVDMIVGISALGTTYEDTANETQLIVPEGIALRALCHDGTNILNSKRVINAFVAGLAGISQYKNSEIKRNGSAAVLNLKSYTWSFDIVPGFFTRPEWDNRTYYIIPNGSGHWMKTDPRADRDYVTDVNQRHDGHVLNAVRLMKAWNRRPTMPTIQPYLLECLVLQHYAGTGAMATSFVDLEAIDLLAYLTTALHGSVPDPKGIQGELNTLDWATRRAIVERAQLDLETARRARIAEQADDQATAIRSWREVFGQKFPTYG